MTNDIPQTGTMPVATFLIDASQREQIRLVLDALNSSLAAAKIAREFADNASREAELGEHIETQSIRTRRVIEIVLCEVVDALCSDARRTATTIGQLLALT